MVKKGSLSGSIITLAGAAFFASMVAQVVKDFQDSLTSSDFVFYSSFEHFSLITIAGIIYVLGITNFFLASIGTKRKSVIAGSIITLLGTIGMFVTFWLGSGDTPQNFTIMVFDAPYVISVLIQVVGALIYMGSIIHHRKYFKIGVFTSFLMFITSVGLVVLSFIIPQELSSASLYNISSDVEELVNINLIVLIAQMFIFGLNGLLFSFCKIGETIEEEDELSVEKGGAFASYVDEGEAYSSGSYDSGDDDIEFEF